MKNPNGTGNNSECCVSENLYKPSCFQVEMSIQSIAVYFQINLRLILVSGKTKEFLFSPNDSASDIAKHVYDNWPMGECWLLGSLSPTCLTRFEEVLRA